MQTHSTVRPRRSSGLRAILFSLLTGLTMVPACLFAQIGLEAETDVSGYTIYVGTNRNNLSPYRTVTKDSLSYTLTGLAPATTYYCSVQAFNSAGVLSGMSPQVSYTTPPAAASVAEITLSDSRGNPMTSGISPIVFGPVPLGSADATKTITIRNDGLDTLSGLAVSVSGSEFQDFLISSPAVTSLAPGASTTFEIAFFPGEFGSRQATVSVISNDSDENPFIIPLSGEGITTIIPNSPELSVLKSDGSELVNGNAALVFPTLIPGVSGIPQIITVKNTGNSVLSRLGLTIDGTHSADYTVSPMLVSSLAAGASTTFSVTFKPGASGNRNAAIHLYSEDADENPFDISLTGVGAAVPDIAVANSSGAELAAGAALSFGSINLDATPNQQFLTIRNTGTSALSGLSVSLSGSHAADFTVSSINSSISPNFSTTVTVTFDPSAVGTRTAVLRIASNDPDENPFDLNLSGVGVAVPDIALATSAGLDLADNGTVVSFGSLFLGTATSAQTFTLRNAGTATLTGLAISLAGTNVADFTVSSLVSSVAAGSSTTFTVTFKPAASGSRTAVLRISSNDADESPFDLNLAGIGIAQPEIVVEKSDGSGLASGSSTLPFGSITLGSTSGPQSLTILNTGTSALTGLTLSLTGLHPSDFTISTLPASLVPGGTTTFTVNFQPTSAGSRAAVLRIASNDADENPFEITLSGTGVAVPEIAVEKHDGAALADNGTALTAGTVSLGSTGSPMAFTIRNQGSAALTGLALSITGSNPSDFTATTLPSTALNASGSMAFSITFKPGAAGPRSAILHISSNDADENPFDISLIGVGGTAPEIAIENQEKTTLITGVDFELFGRINLQAPAVTRILTIHNLGSAMLSGISPAILSGHAGDFAVGLPGSTSLAPGASTTISVTFKPTTAGMRSAVLQIGSNDADEGAFQINLRGTAVSLPDIDVLANEKTATANNFGEVTLGNTSKSLALTIHNRGTADLTNLQVSTVGAHAKDFILSLPTASTVPAGSSLTCSVAFKPEAAGKRSAILRITSNDPDENPIEIPITGSGLITPEIEITAAGSGPLTDNTSVLDFGTTNAGTPGMAKTIIIRNTGSGNLSGLRVLRRGNHADDFEISELRSQILSPGESTNFKVTFIPTGAGNRSASLNIVSNDSTESSFEISLRGVAKSVPNIAVRVVRGSTLADDESFVNFGSGGTKTITITNDGTSNLTGLKLKTSGLNPEDFAVSRIKSKSLAPGKSTTFKVTFKSTGSGSRWAAIKIASNDPDAPSFDIALTGGRSGKSAAIAKSAAITILPSDSDERTKPVKSIVRIDGEKYRCITIKKSAIGSVSAKDIEVSENLTDWSSGARHTTVITDDAELLQVRDNVPLRPGLKRFIRVKPRR